MVIAEWNGVVMNAAHSTYGSRIAPVQTVYMHRGFKSVLWTGTVINELFSLRRTACEEYETLRGGRTGPTRVVYSATRPVALGIVSGRINFRHQFPAGDGASAHPPPVASSPFG